MILKEFRNPSAHAFVILNRKLKSDFGISLNESASADELLALVESAEANMAKQKKGNFKTHQSKDYSKNLLIKETALALLNQPMDADVRQYDTVVNVFVSHVLESVSVGQHPADAFDTVVTICEELRIPFDNYDIYADVKDIILSESSQERKIKEPVEASIWDLLPADRRVRAQEIIQAFKKQGQPGPDTWELEQEIEDPRKGFLIPQQKKTPDMVAHKRAMTAAQMIRPDSVLAGAKLEPIKENTVKNLNVLLENEIEEAEVVAAARNFGSQLQTMIEKIGRLQNEDLGPVVDQMRLSFGNDTATVFFDTVNNELQVILDGLRSAKDNIEVLVGEVATGQPPSTDMDDFGADAPTPNMGDEVPDLNLDLDIDSDEFGGAEMDEPLGRAKKESIEHLRQAINEATQRLAALKARR